MGLMDFVNLAHGRFAMFGGYATGADDRLWRAFPLACAFVAAAAASVVFERCFTGGCIAATELDQVLLTIGLVFIVRWRPISWGPGSSRFQPPEICGAHVLGLRICRLSADPDRLALAHGALLLGLERTRFGAQFARRSTIRAWRSGSASTSTALHAFLRARQRPGRARRRLATEILPSTRLSRSLSGRFPDRRRRGRAGFDPRPIRRRAAARHLRRRLQISLARLGAFFIYPLMMALLMWRPRGLFGGR